MKSRPVRVGAFRQTRTTGRHGVDARRGWARRLAGYAWRYPKDVVLALGASLGGMAVMALVPLITKVIIDDVI
ncbi:hypothetical protein NGM37_38105, partial [Streptomyces sp. TRM76130]|nr:hypothetical protein [Streptomyces sp. TRM76130]